jgi:hypothetical protein
MQVHRGRRLDIGEPGIGVKQHDQLGTLMELVGNRPLPYQLLRVLHELDGKLGLIAGRGTWHGAPPAAGEILGLTAPRSSLSATLC